ncbi:MAG: neutral/alkaline non-lysosomal ceramidase N-terminal domain-containing protein [bacterium]
MTPLDAHPSRSPWPWPTSTRASTRALTLALAVAVVTAGCAGGKTTSARGSGTPLRVGVAVVDVTPTSWERFHDANGNGTWDFADGEPFDDFGRDGIPSPAEPGYDPVTNPDPNHDDFDPVSNASGGEGNGRFEPIWMAGFANAYPAVGVHDPITVRALALAQGDVTTVLVVLDVIGVLTPSLEPALDRIAAETAIDPARILVSAIHSHEGPDTLGLWGRTEYESGIDPVYQARLLDGLVESVVTALGSLREAELAVAAVTLDLGTADLALDHRDIDPSDPPQLANDIRLPSVRDPQLLAIRAVAGDGQTIATLLEWADHPESIGSRNNLISADYPGYARARLEARLGGTAIYLSGALGGLITPLDGALVPYWTDDGKRGTDPATGLSWIADDGFDKARSLGYELAERAADALASAPAIAPDYLDFRRRESRLPMENLNLVLGLVTGVIPGSSSYFSDEGEGLFDFSDPDHCSHCGCIRTPVFRLDLGGLATLVTVPGELFPEALTGRDERRHAFATPEHDYGATTFPAIEGLRGMKGAPETLLVAGLSPNELGYLIPQSDYLDFTVSELLFGGVGSPLSHPNFYAEYFSLGPRAGDTLYCDLVSILELHPNPETRTRCEAVRRSTFVANGSDAVCKLARALPGPLDDLAQILPSAAAAGRSR